MLYAVTRSSGVTVATAQRPGVLWFIAFCSCVVVWALLMDTAVVELTCLDGRCILAKSSLARSRGFVGLFRGSLKAASPANALRFDAGRLAGASVRRVDRGRGSRRRSVYDLDLHLLHPDGTKGDMEGDAGGTREVPLPPQLARGSGSVVEAMSFHRYATAAYAEDMAMEITAAVLHARLAASTAAGAAAATHVPHKHHGRTVDRSGRTVDRSGGGSDGQPRRTAGGIVGIGAVFETSGGSSGGGGGDDNDGDAGRLLALHVREDTASWDEVVLLVALLAGCAAAVLVAHAETLVVNAGVGVVMVERATPLGSCRAALATLWHLWSPHPALLGSHGHVVLLAPASAVEDVEVSATVRQVSCLMSGGCKRTGGAQQASRPFGHSERALGMIGFTVFS